MKLLRNPEVYRSVVMFLITSAAAIVIAINESLKAGMIMMLFCFIFCALHVFTIYQRYKSISKLSAEIDCILHNGNEMPIDACYEGELAILKTEIVKLTRTLREQRITLRNEKIYLADSLADISHQIRTPLTSINLIVSMLSDTNTTEKRRRELIRELKAMLSRIDWLITALLKISKLDADTVQFKEENISLDDLLKKSSMPIQIPAELRGQTIKLDSSGMFRGDIAWTCEALGNIFKNCMEHTPEGGCITASAHDNPLYTEIIITDTGSGIAEKDLPHIFERFYKGSDSGNSSFGIGLALARMIITHQGGIISAANREEGGAVFTIKFYKSTI